MKPDPTLRRLVPRIAEDPAFAALLGRLSASLAVCEPARSLALAGLSFASGRLPLLVATPSRIEAERLAADLTGFLGEEAVEEVPAWETLPFERVSPSTQTMGRRARVLHRLTDPRAQSGAPTVVVASARALAQRIDAQAAVGPIVVHRGGIVDQSQLVERLVAFGYRREYQVEHPGEVAVRGSIVDVYPSTSPQPVRLDFWGDEVDRLTGFSVGDQRTSGLIDTVEVYPCRELRPDTKMRQRAMNLTTSQPWGAKHWRRIARGELFEGMESWWPWLAQRPVTLVDLLSPDSAVVMIEPRRLRDRATDILAEEEDLAEVLGKTWNVDGSDLPRLHAHFDDLSAPDDVPVWTMPAVPDSPQAPQLAANGWPPIRGDLAPRIRRINQLLGDDYKIVLCADGATTAGRLNGLLADHGARLRQPPVPLDLERGAILHDVKLAVLSSRDITGRRRAHRTPRVRASSRDQRRFFDDLTPGSFVVHQHHGVARFEGMVRRAIGGHEREYLLLAYRGGDKLYVPSDQVDSVRQYSGGATPALSRMGGADWSAAKGRVRRAANAIARDLVVLYQKRMTTVGHAFGSDTPWQRELEDSFEYTETRDQLRALADVKDDMERPEPMDRLVVGDVGFGKTEIAVRAVFKAVLDGKQAAILVPTTLLAQQHTQTLGDRFAPFPVRVEMLSRFLTPAGARKVVRGLGTGEVDVVIGTHRLLSADVKFKNLGLLVIDEEQRFGVRHKEIIKSLRAQVDVLTLTATPVPRTLEMSLTGIRDLSLLHTPPADRQPILTYVGEHSERPIAEAIRRELLREGQVFYVHNRVFDIDRVAQRLRRLVPEARVAVAHGQMDEGTLEQVVIDFSEHAYDVLVCTTIIESGIDMPTVNTLVVDGADRLGLGQLHQIRGRVGRSGRRAYAYLLHPADRVLSEQAYERLKTIGEATELGSGYRIAMRDLEIRGAGNLLGEAQSGHIAAVGYDVYCQMVTEAVAELKGETPDVPAEIRIEVPVDAHIPIDYIALESSRLESYRSLASVTEHSEVDDVQAEWTDRFGAIPAAAEALLSVAHLRVDCRQAGIADITVTDGSRGAMRMGGARYRARLSPVRLLASRRVRLRRLYGDSAVYKENLSELHVRLRAGKRTLIEQLRTLISEIVAVGPVSSARTSTGISGKRKPLPSVAVSARDRGTARVRKL